MSRSRLTNTIGPVYITERSVTYIPPVTAVPRGLLFG